MQDCIGFYPMSHISFGSNLQKLTAQKEKTWRRLTDTTPERREVVLRWNTFVLWSKPNHHSPTQCRTCWDLSILPQMEQAVKNKDGWKRRLAAVGGQLKLSRAFSMFLITSYTDGGHENFTQLSFEPRNSLLWSNRANRRCARKRWWIMWTLSRLSEEAFQHLIKSCAQRGWLRISLLFSF